MKPFNLVVQCAPDRCNCRAVSQADLATVSPQETQMFANALYLHPAPALTAELKAELLDALRVAEFHSNGIRMRLQKKLVSGSPILKAMDKQHQKVTEAVTKLTNLESGS
jgi:hypothetical protein